MLTIVFIALFSAFDAVGDTLKDHFFVSVFKRLNQNFWNPELSWKTSGYVPFTKYHLDAWHVAKTLKLTCFALAIVFHVYFTEWWIEAGAVGFAHIMVFNLFYNRILKR